jgi:type IV pilus assembly protein PilP
VSYLLTICLVLVSLVAARESRAEEDLATPSRKTKEAMDKLSREPAAIARKLLEIGASSTKPAQSETKAPSGDGDATEKQKRMTQAQPPAIRPTVRRDPFRPFTLNAKPAARRRENLSPLERYELGQLKVVGVIWDAPQPRAMVEDSAGLGFIVRVGTPIGPSNGTVKSIRPTEIIVEESYVDPYGSKVRREVNMRISPERGE